MKRLFFLTSTLFLMLVVIESGLHLATFVLRAFFEGGGGPTGRGLFQNLPGKGMGKNLVFGDGASEFSRL